MRDDLLVKLGRLAEARPKFDGRHRARYALERELLLERARAGTGGATRPEPQ